MDKYIESRCIQPTTLRTKRFWAPRHRHYFCVNAKKNLKRSLIYSDGLCFIVSDSSLFLIKSCGEKFLLTQPLRVSKQVSKYLLFYNVMKSSLKVCSCHYFTGRQCV